LPSQTARLSKSRRFCRPTLRTEKQILLAKGKANEEAAYRKFYKVMADEDPTRLLVLTADTQAATVCDLFLEWSAKHNEPDTYAWRKRFLQDFCDDYGTVKVAALKPFHMTRWVDKHTGWNSTSQRSAIGCVKRAFNWATDEGLIAGNPFNEVAKPPGKRRDIILSVEEQNAIRDKCRDQCFKDFIFALQETGCRPGEVSNVTADEVDLEEGTWTLSKHKTAHKTGRHRVVYLGVHLTPQSVTNSGTAADRQYSVSIDESHMARPKCDSHKSLRCVAFRAAYTSVWDLRLVISRRMHKKKQRRF
jgi:hypothetical protein